jgi:thiamine biosynthesis protein ThiS
MKKMENRIQVKANGRMIEITEGLTLEQLLEIIEEPRHPDQVVEVNCRYVDSRDYAGVVLQARDRVEVLRVSFWGLRT